MAEQAFLQIKEAEAQAQEIIKNAQEEANRIIRRAEEETADAFSRLAETCKRQAIEKKQKAEAIIRENNYNFSKETADLCGSLKQGLLSKKTRAIDAIIQMITI